MTPDTQPAPSGNLVTVTILNEDIGLHLAVGDFTHCISLISGGYLQFAIVMFCLEKN